MKKEEEKKDEPLQTNGNSNDQKEESNPDQEMAEEKENPDKAGKKRMAKAQNFLPKSKKLKNKKGKAEDIEYGSHNRVKQVPVINKRKKNIEEEQFIYFGEPFPVEKWTDAESKSTFSKNKAYLEGSTTTCNRNVIRAVRV